MDNINRAGYSKPTPVQKHALPIGAFFPDFVGHATSLATAHIITHMPKSHAHAHPSMPPLPCTAAAGKAVAKEILVML